MKRAVFLLSAFVCLVAATLWAQTKLPEKLTVELDRAVCNLYDTVTGSVQGLGAGEKFTVELVDSYGRVTAEQQLKRTGFKGTPFRVQIRWFSTPAMSVRVKGDSERTGAAPLQCVPPTHGWETFLLTTADIAASTGIDRCNVLRLLAFHTAAAGESRIVADFNHCDFRCLALPTAQEGFVLDAAAVQTAIAAHAQRTAKTDFSALKRTPCLSRPDMAHNTLTWLGERVEALSRFNPVGYVLFDAPGITPANRAVDFCFDEQTLKAFRTWLADRYPSVGALSRQWDEKFRRWDDVIPMTAPDILGREYAKFKRSRIMNFAPWVDHRAFMDEKFGTALIALGAEARLAHRGVRVGFRGGLAPAAYGGCDWSYLAEAFDFMECADETFKRLAASLNRQRPSPGYTIGTVSDRTGPGEFVRQLWTNAADGDLGAVVQPGTNLLDARGLPTPLAYKARPSLRALEGFGHVMVDKDFAPATKGVYLYYSPSSVRVQYVLDAGALGEAFRLGESADSLSTSTWHRNLRGWVDLLDDLGIEFECLSSRKVTRRGWSRDVKVVILPKVVALSEAEASALRKFVEGGGTLIADSQTGIFDEHGTEQQRPPLDTLFGVRRDGIRTAELAGRYVPGVRGPMRHHREMGRFKGLLDGVPREKLLPVEPSLEPLSANYHLQAGRTHALFTRTVRGGNAVYLNLSLLNYTWDRSDPENVAGLRQVMKGIFAVCDVTPGAVAVKVGKTPLPDIALRQLKHRNNDYLVVLRRGLPPEAPPAPAEPAPEEPPEVEPEPAPVLPEPAPVLPEPAPVLPEPAPGVNDPPHVQFHQVAPPAEPAPDEAVRPASAEPDKPLQPMLKTPGADYRVKPGDVIGVEVRGQPELTRITLVRDDGKITLNLLGDVEVSGLTVEEIDAKLTQGYAEYIVGADVTVRAATAAAEKEPGEEKKEEPKEPVLKGDFFKIKLERERYVYDLILGRSLGKTSEPEVFLPDGECAVLALLDYEVKSVGVELALRPQEMTYRVKLSTTGTAGLHAFRVEFIDPKGSPVEEYATTLAAPGGYAGGVFHLGIGEKSGEWTLRVTDVLTGTKGEAKFTLK